jgi:hypothetical protein
MLTDQKWQITAAMQPEVIRETPSKLLFAAESRLESANPILAWGVFLQPCERSGQQKLSARFYKPGKT